MSTTGPVPTIVQRLRVYVEPAGTSTFAVDHTGTLGDFTDVPAQEGSISLELNQDTHNPAHVLQDVRDYQVEVVGKKGWSLSFTVPFAPTGVAASASKTGAAGPLSPLLGTIMGGEFRGRGSTAATGGWGSAGGGAVATASGFRAGGVAGVVISGVYYVSPIKSVIGSTVTLKRRFPSAPASGQAIYSGVTYYWTRDPNKSLQFIVEGQEANDRWVLLGGQGTVQPELTLDGEVQALTFEITGPKWLHAADAAGSADLNGTAIGNATYSNYEPITGHAGELIVRTNGVTTYTGSQVHASAINFENGMTYQPIPSPSGVEGVLRHRLVRASGTPPIAGSFATFYEDTARWTNKTNKTALMVFYRAGTTKGQAVAVDAPTVQVVNPQLEDQDNVKGQTVEFRGRMDDDAALPTSPSTAETEQGTSPWRIHLA